MTYFNIKNITKDNNIVSTITLDAEHEIFKGHFPGFPILPGVCMIQMITSVLATVFTVDLKLLKADNIKFLSMLNPFENAEISIEITIKDQDSDFVKSNAIIKTTETVVMKFSGTHQFIKK